MISAPELAEHLRGQILVAPRVLEFVLVKRNLPLVGRSYGHWWLEIDGSESYGWWPGRSPLRTRDVLCGGPGVLNGGPAEPGGGWCDPNHGLVADYEFHPMLMATRSDDDVRDAIRLFATTFAGEWRWSLRPTMNCRLFQLALFDSVGLVDGTGHYASRGSGCPILAPIRRLTARLTGRRYWPTNLPAPGQPVVEVLDEGALVSAATVLSPTGRLGSRLS